MPPELIEITPQTPFRYTDGEVSFLVDPSDGTELIDLGIDDESALTGGFDFASQEFGANLAEALSSSQRRQIAQTLIEYHRVDLESRADWEAMARQALTLLGIEKIDQTKLPFPGAASVQHPVIAEAVVQFNSNAIEEFYPATGPVKGLLVGRASPELEDSVERATGYMNYYLTVEDRGYYADSDQMLFYLPIAGSVFRKAWIDPRDGLPRLRYVKAEDFVAPYYARDLENCNRYCHQYQMTGSEIRRSMETGEFMALDLPPPPMEAPESTGKEQLEDKADRRQRSLHQDDTLYDILEYHIDFALPAGVDEYGNQAMELPYIIVVDKTSGELLSVRRNWRKNDRLFRKRVWFAHYKFFPGLGFYGWGFLHVIGSLADGVSGSVRALLDSALMATLQGGFRAKDGAKRAGSIAVEPGKWKDIDATFDELNKTFYTPPFREPSPALANLFTALVQDARRFASITEVLVGTADNKAPVGTTLALIEQSMKLFTAIHKRIFNSAAQEFAMLAELFFEYGPDRYPYRTRGDAAAAFKQDFDTSTIDFVPVADPNIISDVQRLAISQALLELMRTDPELYPPEKRVEAHKAFIKALKVPDPEKYEPELPRATFLDPLGENMMMMTGRPVRAFPGQRHDLHRQTHMVMIETARNTLPPDQFEPLYMAAMAHIREHDALQMMETVSSSMQQTMGVPLPPIDIYQAGQDMDPQLEMALAIAASQNLPPVPPPQPGSAGAAAGAESDKAAEIQRQTEAKNAEVLAKIERETMAFVSQEKRKAEEHDAQLRREEEAFRAEQRRKDAETAAEILRTNARAKADMRTRQQASALELHHKDRSALLDELHQRAASESKLEQERKAGELKLKTAQESAKAKARSAARKPAGKKRSVH